MDLSWLLAADRGPFPGDKAFLSFFNFKRKNLNFGCLCVHRTEWLLYLKWSGAIAAQGRGITYGETASHFLAEAYG